jgi:hypothetical protein
VFSKGHLVQIYPSDLDYTFKTERKLLPKWSTPQRVVSRHLNSYKLEDLNGEPLTGSFSARRLRRFFPKEGTRLADEQKLIEERITEGQQEERSRGDEERSQDETQQEKDTTPTHETDHNTRSNGE